MYKKVWLALIFVFALAGIAMAYTYTDPPNAKCEANGTCYFGNTRWDQFGFTGDGSNLTNVNAATVDGYHLDQGVRTTDSPTFDTVNANVSATNMNGTYANISGVNVTEAPCSYGFSEIATLVICNDETTTYVKDGETGNVIFKGTNATIIINNATQDSGKLEALIIGDFRIHTIYLPEYFTLHGIPGKGNLTNFVIEDDCNCDAFRGLNNNAGNITLQDFTIDGNGGQQTVVKTGITISLGSGNNTIEKLTVKNVLGKGIQISQNSHNTVRNNKVSNVSSNGIDLFAYVNFSTVSNNVVEGAGDVGILLNRGNQYNSVKNNVVLRSATDGIQVKGYDDTATEKSRMNTVSGNTVFGAGSNGIYFNTLGNEDNTASDNTLDGNSRAGIEVAQNATRAILKNNHINNTNGTTIGRGIFVQSGYGHTVCDNEIRYNYREGITFTSSTSNSKICSNTVYNSGLGGAAVNNYSIYINGTKNTVQLNTIDDDQATHTQNGIFEGAGGDYNHFESNVVLNATVAPLSLQGANTLATVINATGIHYYNGTWRQIATS